MLDSVMLQSGIPFDISGSTKRNYNLLEKIIDANLDHLDTTSGGP